MGCLAEGLDWKGDWTVGTRYRVNDFVKYGGITYVCNTLHTSNADASGLEADPSKWTDPTKVLTTKQPGQQIHAIRKMILYYLVQVYIM